MTVTLRVPGSTSTIEVSDEAADGFRSRGFQDVASGKETPEPEPPAPEAEPEPETTQEADATVPEGTAAEILAWVDGDVDRAQAALDRERTYEKPRIGLSGELTELIEKE